MTIARLYIMTAAEGQGATLEAALSALADAVKTLPGSEGVEMLRDVEKTDRFIFIEKWASIDEHKAAGKLLPKELMMPLRTAAAGPPDGSYLDYLKRI